MPILQKTIDYLLILLDQPYDEKFLGLYNFLWDRMRAVRMDMRMQQIFNLDAIKMLEQMIRLHIIAMYELCEYTKGEGFSEGFDAHLNVEQMNKTSVELFQLYDDHRKKGIQVPTEKEFRGYYALLKLDKHPGYKVNPAELSLELSKMTPEIRQTREVLFAREVARACRTGNFIAFFRLARKATYLQACLMHAHFAKLRTQALAYLCCVLQNNQGIPVAHVAKWLAMEEEDIESLLEYHGFLIKEFEEPYMVKDGPFLNIDNDYPVKCSELVHMKKSQTIFEDVSTPHLYVSSPAEEIKEAPVVKAHEQETKHFPLVEMESQSWAVDEEMADYEVVPSPKSRRQVKHVEKAFLIKQSSGDGNQMTVSSPLSCGLSPAHDSPKSQLATVGSMGKLNCNTVFWNSFGSTTQLDAQAIPSQTISEGVGSIKKRSYSSVFQNFVGGDMHSDTQPIEGLEDEERADDRRYVETEKVEASNQDEEVAEAKLKLMFRLWKRNVVKRRKLREERQVAAMAALNSLSLGPPIRQVVEQPSTSGDFNIDHILTKRYERHRRSWSRLNVSDVISDILSKRNPTVKCFCWKIILCSLIDGPDGDKLQQLGKDAQFSAGPWLLSKLMPTRKDDEKDENDEDLIISSPGLSIWKKWLPNQLGGDLTCCLSIVRDMRHDVSNEVISGASAVLFLVSESVSLEIQKLQLHNLLMSLPSGSSLPLLIVIDSYEENSESSTAVAGKLGLHSIDKSRVSKFSVIFLAKDQKSEDTDGFFSDEQLRRGLRWLASQSPLQPTVIGDRTHDLVYTHLSSSLNKLDQMGLFEVGPDHCISVFNEALGQAVRKVTAAAEANPTSWPCPEIAFLEKSSYEYEIVKLYFPDIGWSSLKKIDPLVHYLRGTELPAFEDDISWLYKGSYLGSDIEHQRRELENCLIRYLTQSSKMMGPSLATNEALVMLQKGALLELKDSSYYIIPKWVLIFRRVFLWRLMGLSNGPFSMTYVLADDRSDVSSPAGSNELGIQDSEDMPSSPCYLIHPSLDEMVEVGCGSFLSYDATQSSLIKVPSGGNITQVNSAEMNFDMDSNSVEVNNNDVAVHRPNKTSFLGVVTKEAVKLSRLLEQCNVLQDIIGKTLSIYFEEHNYCL